MRLAMAFWQPIASNRDGSAMNIQQLQKCGDCRYFIAFDINRSLSKNQLCFADKGAD